MTSNPERFRATGLETSEISRVTAGIIFDALRHISQETVGKKERAKNDNDRKQAELDLHVQRLFILNSSIDEQYDAHYNFIGKKKIGGGQQ